MFRHPNLVTLMGFARNGPKRFLVWGPQVDQRQLIQMHSQWSEDFFVFFPERAPRSLSSPRYELMEGGDLFERIHNRKKDRVYPFASQFASQSSVV